MTLLDLLLLLLTYLNTYPAILVKINFLFLFYILCTHSSLKLSKKYHVVRIPNTPISKVRWYNKNFITSKVYFFFYHIVKLLYHYYINYIYIYHYSTAALRVLSLINPPLFIFYSVYNNFDIAVTNSSSNGSKFIDLLSV